MTGDYDFRNWSLWGQSGTALIDGQWVDGIAVYRHQSGLLVHFISTEHLGSPLQRFPLIDHLREVAVDDFRPYPDTRPFCEERQGGQETA